MKAPYASGMTSFNVTLIRSLAFSAVMACSLPLFAADTEETQWKDLCAVANGRELIIKTDTGDTVTGYCSTISIDAIDIMTKDRRIVTIARKGLSRIQIHRTKGHQLQSLGRGIQTGLRQGSDWLFSPAALAGIVTIPATLAWGAVSAPFCLLADLRYHLADQKEIKVK